MFRKSLSVVLLGVPFLFGACSDEPDEPVVPTALIIDRKSFDFGDWEVGKPPAEQLFTVRNASPGNVESVSVSVEGSDSFTLTSSTCEKYLAAGMECEVRVGFAPRLGGTHSARLKVGGASSVEQTSLQGTGFAWVEVSSLPSGTRVVAGDGSFTCTQPCRQAVRKAEVTLYAGPEGFPAWSAACASAPRGGCLLRLDASKSAALETWVPLYQWEVRRSRPPVTVAPLANGSIVVLDALSVTSLDSTGQERWSLPLSADWKLAVTSDGHISLLRYNGSVTQYDSDGRVRWTYRPQESLFSKHVVADGMGNTYVLTSKVTSDTAQVLKLFALSRDGVELWSAIVNEAHLTFSSGLGVVGDGSAVYVSGSAYNRTEPPPANPVFVKNFVQKLTPAGVVLWTKEVNYGEVSFAHTGDMSSIIKLVSPPGGLQASWTDPDGKQLWSAQTPTGQGPGVVDTFAFPPNDTTAPRLLLGGHELRPGTDTYGRGWFADMGDRSGLVRGSITYIDSPYNDGAWVSSLAYTSPARQVVVGGGFGSSADSATGFIRLYDPRTLTLER
ncbi:choice-of-anchor D domain-containing protein [Corallococcus macrosporus]|uniref:Choice-of-anchor D domain-containing protein n=1 Tax=Corallococcus macrosporus TaxID=35 RepID=A0ABS3DPE9_9BACT|nr:choice-of-anchor D domain-containing protein [Corallococcus macrosporus]MBN8233205.1 choice-of-anchor D domain-containing protein [Corallococcus macrosporus]